MRLAKNLILEMLLRIVDSDCTVTTLMRRRLNIISTFVNRVRLSLALTVNSNCSILVDFY